MKTFRLLKEFLTREKAGGFVLIICTVISLILANSAIGGAYIQLWEIKIAGGSIAHWVNDGLMTLFFLLIGLELKREFVQGQFKSVKKAILPIFAAIGGMLLPAGIHALFNYGTPTQAGAGIPMATDVAFALAILSLVGNRAPAALKILLMAIAVIDDLGSIIVIAVFYTAGVSWLYLAITLAVFGFLMLLNRLGVSAVIIYILGGMAMWYLMLHSGVHATISGVLLAVAIPFSNEGQRSTSNTFLHMLNVPVPFIVLPLFALANTAIILKGGLLSSLATLNGIGIILGLLVGKPLGISLFTLLAIKVGAGSLPGELNFKHVIGIGILAAIGFTISILISSMAFEQSLLVEGSKIAVIFSSLLATLLSYLWLHFIAIKSQPRIK